MMSPVVAEASVSSSESLEPPAHRRWYRRPRWVVSLVVIGVLACVAVPFAIAWSHRGAKEASIDKAVANFRKSHGASTAGFLRPPGGVYTFVGTGTEKLSLLATTQQWGPRIPVTVTEDTNQCWNFRVDYSTHHWQSTQYCARGRELQEPSETTFQSFDFVAFKANDTNEVVCNPAIDRIRVDARAGSTWHVACDGRSKTRGTKFHAQGTDTLVDVERIPVGAELVPAYHYSVDRALSGSQSGYERYDIWYSALDGLPVKTDRHVMVKSPSPIGTVTYTESGAYTLTSLKPQR
jgi:hypothetical protein